MQAHRPLHASKSKVGSTLIGGMSRAATVVKMKSNSQGTFWGSVKLSSNVLGHYIYSTVGDPGVADCLRMHS